MRPLQFFSKNKKRNGFIPRSGRTTARANKRRHNYSSGLLKFEKAIIRAVVLSAVFLVLAQMALGLAKDPVDYYISVAQNVEAPSLDSTPVSSTVTPNLIQEATSQTSLITLKAVPAAPVRVIQNGKVLGTLARGELEIPVQGGILQLDGTNVSAIVRIQVIRKDSALTEPRLNQTVIIEHNVQTLRVSR
ncbi:MULTISPECIES: hypothetical protein [Desulfitobacterium]|uniref:Uncharacterized protein n=1 Tax=Desulfitobacterium dehalogenans (strain ATCC 51507 / DSM 9161 / JW/IU-DC1) TaxID=756499 RepID=I4AB12_DESDJ|nr:MULTISPECIES: hypothetical protein [Desulfitobacterium]AFM01147.1 hypothetical protein Desde_2844 [Desulfitobacterium dehalogenans ATCC 51507]